MNFQRISDTIKDEDSASAPPRPWWSRPIVTMPASDDREPNCNEFSVFCTPVCGGFLTVFAIFLLLTFVDVASSHAKFSIQSIVVSPSTATSTWNIDFLVKNPTSRYSINYDGYDASVTLGPLNAAVLSTSRIATSKDDTTFSLKFLTEGNQSDVVLEELDVKLMAKHKRFLDHDQAGVIDVRCLNIARSHENIENIKCHSSFKAIDSIVI